jgi:hypothetical protein
MSPCDGTAVYFKTPAARRSIACGGGAAIVMYFIEGGSADWMVEVGGEGSRMATSHRTNSNRLDATVKVGDRITVRGSIKTETVSKAGKPYKVLNRVRRVML